MKFGIVYPNTDEYLKPELASEVSIRAERAGFKVLLTWDHYMVPRTNRTMDAWTFLSFIAARTNSIQLGTCVTPIPLRNPAILAKIVATLDVLSGGRVLLGAGAGWHRPEFDAFSVWDEPKIRVAKVEEGIHLITTLWKEERVSYKGKYYSVKDASIEPKPVQKPYPEIWFGSTGRKMLSIALRFGTGWIPTMIDLDKYTNISSTLLRKRPDLKLAYNLYDPLYDYHSYVDLIEKLNDAKCQYLIINWRYKPDEMVKRIDWFAKELINSFS
ncbi:MAG: LLM class flavin-dependent oxidoreductase [Nitrososphaerota archaeon]